ncbi:MAG: universal stress protein [Pyrinomonadaceae bacterium]
MRILLATDGSDHSRFAAEECGKLASAIKDARVKIITAIDNFTPMATDPFITTEEFLEIVTQRIRENAEKSISVAKEIVENAVPGIETETEILVGLPKKTIIEEAESWEADLIMVGSHGYGFWGRKFLGSVSDAVVHHAPCSVWVARNKAG